MPDSPKRIALFTRLLLQFSFCLLAGLCLLTPAQAQTDLSTYFPTAVGDSWTFESPLGQEQGDLVVFLITSEETAHSGARVLRRDESNGDFRLQRKDSDGLWLESVHFVGDVAVEYQEPALLFPSKLAVGAIHRAEVPYRTIALGQEIDTGSQSYEVTRSANASVKTFAGTFDNCLVTTTKALRKSVDGTSKGYTLKEWHAATVGLVKVKGELFWNDNNGQPTRTVPVDAVLSGATVGARLIEDASASP